MRKYFQSAAFIASVVVFITGCKPNDVIPVTPDPIVVVPVDDVTQVFANVSGIVLDESNAPVAGAVVTSGTATAVTNAIGMFSLVNISLSKNNGSVTVTKPGYFKGVRSFKTSAGKDHQVKIQLMQKLLSGTVNGATGGTINSNGGAVINFPANAFVTTAGAAYSGTVNVYSRWIDPTANNLPYIVPGDLRGVGTNGGESILQTYGMVGAEIEDASGNTLSIASGKTAAINFPVPAAIAAAAPASIALWHFDNASARWKEEGTATKSGSTYTAQVNKFSFWNCDIANSNFIVLDYTLINAATNTPLVGTSTRIKVVSSSAYGYGITNSAGFVSGLVPKNEPLVLEVIAGACASVVYSQNIGPFANNTSLGNVNVGLPTSQYINFTGKIVNCSAAPVTNGYISMYGSGGNSGFAHTNASGDFSFTILNCTGSSLNYSCIGVDNSTGQQTAVITGTASTAAVNIGTITACTAAPTVDIYLAGFGPLNTTTVNNVAKVWKNGTATNLTDASKNGRATSVYVSGTDVYTTTTEQDLNTGFTTSKVWKNGVPTTLTNGTTNASVKSVFVSGTDVYVAGTDGAFAKVWKNGIATNLNLAVNPAIASAVFVSGSDVYVAGMENYFARVWKNGSSIFTLNTVGDFTSIFVSGTDVYVAGWEYNGSKNVAKVWKNGVATSLTNGTRDAKAFSVFVSGTDVYVSGYETNPTGFITGARLWKNGVATNLTNGNFAASATGVFVLGTDVYVAGAESNGSGNTTAIVWKNGFPVNITDGTTNVGVNAIFVK